MDDFLQIGQTLQTARESRELTFEDATHQTRIPRSVLTALENDDYSVFSSSTYARSYLSQYSEFLGVDASTWLDAFEPAEFVHDYHSFPIIDAGEIKQEVLRGRPTSSRKFIPSFLGLLLTATVLYGGYQILTSFEQREGVIEKSTTKTTDQNVTQENATEVASASPTEVTSGNVSVPNTPSSIKPTTTAPLIDNTPTAPPRAVIVNEDE